MLYPQWLTANELDPRSNTRFHAASGTLSMNAANLTSARELEFVLDAGETDNGVDDDGDGMIDEGSLFLQYESARIPLAENVESCSFEIDGPVIRFSVQCAQRDSDGQIHRAVARRVWLIRNP